MLTRAATRHARHPVSINVLASFQQLQLPWLCPSVEHCVRRQSRRSSNIASNLASSPRTPSRSPTRSRGATKASTRQLATVADTYQESDFVPFQDLSFAQERLVKTKPYRTELSDLRPFSPKDIVQIKIFDHAPPPVFKKASHTSFTGDTGDLLPHLYACVQVGQLDRASKVILNMAKHFSPDANELRDAHHRYLLGNLDVIQDSDLVEEKKLKTYEHMQRWFKTSLMDRGVVPGISHISIMIKAAFTIRSGTQLDRTIRYYLKVATDVGLDEHSVVFADLFLPSELARMLRMSPEKYIPVDEEALKSPIDTVQDEVAQLEIKGEARSTLNASVVGLPEIKATNQKGSGLKALKNSLATFYVDTPGTVYTEEEAHEIAKERQLRLERDVLQASIDRWKEDAEDTQAMRARGQLVDPELGSYVYEWIQQMAILVKEELRLGAEAIQREDGKAQAEDIDRITLHPFLKFAEPEKLCAAAIIAYVGAVNDLKAGGGGDKSLVGVVSRIGNAVVHEIQLEGVRSDLLQKYRSLPSPERRRRLATLLRNNKHADISSRSETNSESEGGYFAELSMHPPTSIRAKVGALFVSLIMKVAKLPVVKVGSSGKIVTQIQPVATHVYLFRKGKKVGVLRTNPEFLNRLKREPVGSFIAKYLPMLIEPGKWTGLRTGPYLESRVQAVRFRDTSNSQQEYLHIADKRGYLKQFYAGLDVISKVPWRINRPILKVLTDAWNSGEQIGKLAPENPISEYPSAPDTSDVHGYRRWKSLVKAIDNEVTGFHSQRCYQNFQLEVARAYANEERFYCPHNADFRGRAYPIPPYFNHMGADYVRGLFLFANGKELGEDGLRWLKIHLANAYGFDKERLTDREQFAMDHLVEIYDSANNPLDGKRWWLTGGHPWQLLAACIELKSALDSPVPSKYISHLPIQQDGTCNGLQHYAALGGDMFGAQQVNLIPGDKPADIYSAVADLVKEDVKKEAANGNKLAQALEGKITRKVVKQPVMTNVYGVTYHGAKEQVRKQLMDIFPKATLDNDLHLGSLSAFVATSIFGALGKMFTGAQAIQQWLGECGARISQAVTPEQIERIKARRERGYVEMKHKRKQLRSSERESTKEDYQFKSAIIWTTPLGMPVVQPYRAAKLKAIKTSLQDIYFEEASLSDPVSKRKQLQAFPPNFIHSLDSCHMMLSALKCDEHGLTFASVHDSFWTHASEVPVMNCILRDAFVRMHSEDIIGRLREEFITRYSGCFHYRPIALKSELAQKINKLRMDNKTIKTSKSKFSRGLVTEGPQVDELVQEYERLRLLRSEDPEEQARGRAMVTPNSLFEADPEAELPVSDASELQVLGSSQAPASVRMRGAVFSTDDELDIPGFEEAERVAEGDESGQDEMSPEQDLHAVETQANAEIVEHADGTRSEEGVEERSTKKKGKGGGQTKKRRADRLYLWTPISFPPAPLKGDFKVSELKDSQYFFS